MFKLLGVLVLGYVLFAAWRGEVFARTGLWGKTLRRADAPHYFWLVIACYGLLGLALLTVF